MFDDTNSVALTIAKFCILLIIGLVLISGIASNSNVKQLNQISISIIDQPNDGDTITLDNHIFEFDNNGVVGNNHITVLIGADVDATKMNLQVAIAANTNYGVN